MTTSRTPTSTPAGEQEPAAPNASTLWAKLIVDELARCGLRAVCISPGSRSTPLVVQFAEHPQIEDISIIDERSAGFFALGMAQASRRPVALVCTSGTAAANYLPAVCEADASNVPLLVLSADRPAQLHDCGASQAMDQARLYGTHVRWFHQVADAEPSPDKLRYVRSVACRAFSRAQAPKPGPVHLNIPFRKPLEPIAVADDHRDSVPANLAERAPLALNGRPEGRPFVEITTGSPSAPPDAVARLVEQVRRAERPVVLAGADRRGPDYRDALLRFSQRFGVPIIAEATSGLRYQDGDAPNVVTAGDFLFGSSLYDHAGDPDLVIRTGRAPILWSAQAFACRAEGAEHILVGALSDFASPEHLLAQQIVSDEAAFFGAAAELNAPSKQDPPSPSTWLELHQHADRIAKQTLGGAIGDDDALSAPGMWVALGESLPDGASLFVSNSMPIRNLDTFMAGCTARVDVFFNRGLNGIDGIISTGLGVAATREVAARHAAPSVIVTGDVALRHDLAALLLATELDIDATVVVVDNDGGAIFDYLPIARFDEVHERHFATSSRRRIDPSLLASVGVEEPTDWPDFRRRLQNSFETPGLQIIRVQTDRKTDRSLRESLRDVVADKINAYLNEYLRDSRA